MSSKFLRATVFLLCASTACVSQVSSSLSGSVTDSLGAAIANAEVTLTLKETNVKRTSRTDEQGQFGFTDVPSGAFVLTVISRGFQKKAVEGVAGIGQSSRIDVVLAATSSSEVITVESSPSLEATWNAWVEDPGKAPSFNRLKTVHTKSDYQLVLDLAAFAYAPKDKSVSARPAGSGLLQWMQHQKNDSVRLKILMVPDPAMLSAGGQRVQNFDINLSELKKYLRGGKHKIPKDPFLSLQKKPQSDFRFGSAQFEFHTEDHDGNAYIGLSLWAGDTPLDEILVPVCISDAGDPDSCESLGRNAVYHSDPLNALPLGLAKDTPVTSLHFFDFDSNRAIGVFRSKNGDYLTWSIANLTDSLSGFIEKVLLKNFEKEVSEDAIQQTGYELYNLLLPTGHPDADKARNEIQELAAQRIKMTGSLADAPPFMIRLATFNPSEAFFVPLAMMAVPVEGRKYFLGDYFRVASPLPFQNYQPAQACVSRWVMLMAPHDDQSPKELVDARDQLSTWANACLGADCIDSMPKFETWIGEQTVERQSTALLILSHYENDSLTFDHKEFVSPSAIIRQFQSPSIAVVDACAAAAPGADGFVKKLNESGFEAVVATTTTVTPIMAGQYFNLLAKQLAKHKGEAGYSISKAHFEAVHELRTAQSNAGTPKAAPYGAKALIYSLWGNGSLSLCPLTPSTVSASER